MLSALLRYPRSQRREIAQVWARRSNVAQAAARRARPVDFPTQRWRALQAARGRIERAGCDYTAAGRETWYVRRAAAPGSRTNQFEYIRAGRLVQLAGRRAMPCEVRPDGSRGAASE